MPHLGRARLLLIEIEVDDVPHFLAAAVDVPVVAVERQRPTQPALDARQRAAPLQDPHLRLLWRVAEVEETRGEHSECRTSNTPRPPSPARSTHFTIIISHDRR